jgi:hypothetical protein
MSEDEDLMKVYVARLFRGFGGMELARNQRCVPTIKLYYYDCSITTHTRK